MATGLSILVVCIDLVQADIFPSLLLFFPPCVSLVWDALIIISKLHIRSLKLKVTKRAFSCRPLTYINHSLI